MCRSLPKNGPTGQPRTIDLEKTADICATIYPQAKFGKGLCKHVAAVEVWLAGQWAALHERTVTIIKRPSVKRYYGCKKSYIVRDGHRSTKRKGKVQKYLCRKCGRRFSGLRKMKGHHAPTGVMADGFCYNSCWCHFS